MVPAIFTTFPFSQGYRITRKTFKIKVGEKRSMVLMEEKRITKSGPMDRLHRVCLSCNASTSGTMIEINDKPRDKFCYWNHFVGEDGKDVYALFCFGCGTINNVRIEKMTNSKNHRLVYIKDKDGDFHYRSNPEDLHAYFNEHKTDRDTKKFVNSNAYKRLVARNYLPSEARLKNENIKKRKPSPPDYRMSDIDAHLGQPVTLEDAAGHRQKFIGEQAEKKTDGYANGLATWFFFSLLSLYMEWTFIFMICGVIGVFWLIGAMIAFGWRSWLPWAMIFVGFPLLQVGCQALIF